MRNLYLRKLVLPLVAFGIAAGCYQASAQRFQIFAVTNIWKYNTTCLDETGWEQPAYDDGAWSSGPGGFTGGENNATLLPQLNTRTLPAPNSAGFNGHAMYFRTHFNVASSANLSLILSNAVDDAAVFYLNGIRVRDLRVTANPALCATLGGGAACSGTEACLWEVITLDATALAGIIHDGDNVLAVSVHQNGTGSSDMVFATVLMGEISFAPVNCDLSNPADTNVLQCRTLTLRACFDGAPTPTLQWYGPDQNGNVNPIDPLLNPSATTATLVITNAQDGIQGNYYCVATSTLGTVHSRTNTVTFTPDDVGPVPVRALGHVDGLTIQITFNEPINASAFDAASIKVRPKGGGTELDASFNFPAYVTNSTDLVFQTVDPRQPGVNYDVWFDQGGAGVVDTCIGNPVADFTTVDVLNQVIVLPIDAQHVWRYNATDTDPGAAWMDRGYDDSGWSTGTAVFDGKTTGARASICGFTVGTQLPLDRPSAAGTRIPGYYFRTLFNFDANPSGPNNRLVLQYFIDDSAIIYINGQEAARIGLNAGVPVPFGTYGNGTGIGGRTTGDPGTTFEASIQLPLTNVVTGENLLAVHLIQVNATSSDISLVAQLDGQVEFVPAVPITIVTEPVASQTVNEGQRVSISVEVTGTSPYFQWFHDGAPVGGNSSTLVIPSATSADQGIYKVVVTNKAPSTVSSIDSHLTVIPDTTAPTVLSANGGRPTNITVLVTFSEPVAQASAENIGNYTLLGSGGITVTGAALSGNSAVTLTLSGPRTANENYSLRVKDIFDRAFTPNVLSPNPTTVPVATVVEVIAAETHSWKYLQSTADGAPPPCLDGTPWTAPGYDDGAWQSGFGVFYGHRDPATRPATEDGSAVNTYLNVFTNAANVIQETNYYFRTTFTLPSADTNGVSLLLHSMVDDGAVFYLNGHRVDAVNYTPDPAACTNLASALGGQTWSPALAGLGRVIRTTGLVAGQNTLAVQLAQEAATSSDVTFDVLLESEIPTVVQAARLSYVYDNVAQTLTLSWTAAGYALEEGTEVTGGTWTQIATSSPHTVSTATGTKFYRLHKLP